MEGRQRALVLISAFAVRTFIWIFGRQFHFTHIGVKIVADRWQLYIESIVVVIRFYVPLMRPAVR